MFVVVVSWSHVELKSTISCINGRKLLFAFVPSELYLGSVATVKIVSLAAIDLEETFSFLINSEDLLLASSDSSSCKSSTFTIFPSSSSVVNTWSFEILKKAEYFLCSEITLFQLSKTTSKLLNVCILSLSSSFSVSERVFFNLFCIVSNKSFDSIVNLLLIAE